MKNDLDNELQDFLNDAEMVLGHKEDDFTYLDDFTEEFLTEEDDSFNSLFDEDNEF
jgi:hypothetical protein